MSTIALVALFLSQFLNFGESVCLCVCVCVCYCVGCFCGPFILSFGLFVELLEVFGRVAGGTGRKPVVRVMTAPPYPWNIKRGCGGEEVYRGV